MFSEDSLTWGWHKLCALVLYGSREKRSWEFLICWMLYTLWPCQSHPLWSGNWTFYCFSVNYRYVVLENGFLALFVAIWLERLRRFWSLNPQRRRRCLANISGLRRLFFLSFFLLALAWQRAKRWKGALARISNLFCRSLSISVFENKKRKSILQFLGCLLLHLWRVREKRVKFVNFLLCHCLHNALIAWKLNDWTSWKVSS